MHLFDISSKVWVNGQQSLGNMRRDIKIPKFGVPGAASLFNRSFHRRQEIIIPQPDNEAGQRILFR